jgi:hypothetical protein
MKLKYTLSLICTTLLLVGCGDSNSTSEVDNTEKTASQRTLVSGETTLANAQGCLDTNNNKNCDVDETQFETSYEGAYEVTHEGELQEGTTILLGKGYNLLLQEENSLMTMLSNYENSATNNINTFTTLIAQKIEQGKSLDEALQEVAQHFDFKSERLLEHPLSDLTSDEGKKYFLTLRAIEDYYLNSQDSKRRAVSTVITQDDADRALLSTDIFAFDMSEYKFKLKMVLLNFAAKISAALNIREKLPFSSPIVPTLPREELNGVWYNTAHASCNTIDSNKRFVKYDVNNTITDYYINYTAISTYYLALDWEQITDGRMKMVFTNLENGKQGYNMDHLNVKSVRENSNSLIFSGEYFRLASLQSCLEQAQNQQNLTSEERYYYMLDNQTIREFQE